MERCHRSLRSKIEHDLNKMGKDGVNWVKQLPRYQIILNNDPKEVIAYKTPFEIYFARRCSSIKESRLVEECLPSSGRIHPTGNDRKRRSQNASKVRKQAQKATKICEKRAQRTQLESALCLQYRRTVYVRLRGSALNKRHVVEASIERRNSKLHTYKVSYISPHSEKKERKWVPVDDITSITLQCEKQKQQEARLSKRKKQEHHKEYLITKGKEDYAEAIEDQGFHIVYNPPGPGSCQFAALSRQIRKLGIHRSPKTIRKEIVEYLERNPYDSDGFPLLEHLTDNEFASWTNYIEYMAQDGTCGDKLTLYAAANLYNVEIRIASSLGEGGQHVFSPTTSNSKATVNLGHFAENEGEHYVSLEQVMTDNDNCENEIGGSIPGDFSSDIAAGDTESNNIEGAEIDDAFNVDDRGKEGSSNHDTEIRNGEDDFLREVETGDSDQIDRIDQNEDINEITDDGEEQMALQFVPDEEVGFLAPKIRSSNIEDLPNELLEKIFKIILMSSAVLFHAYQRLRGVNSRFRAVAQNLTGMLPKVYIPRGVEYHVISVRRIIKEYRPSSGLVIEVRRIISNPKWANAWLDIERGEYGFWYIIKRIFWKKRWRDTKTKANKQRM